MKESTSDRLTHLQEFLKETPSDPFLHYALATELLKLERVEEALQGFVKLTVDYPDYVGTYYHLGKLYESLSDTDAAIDTYEKGMHVARAKGDRHALSELQAAWRLANGMDEDDDDYA